MARLQGSTEPSTARMIIGTVVLVLGLWGIIGLGWTGLRLARAAFEYSLCITGPLAHYGDPGQCSALVDPIRIPGALGHSMYLSFLVYFAWSKLEPEARKSDERAQVWLDTAARSYGPVVRRELQWALIATALVLIGAALFG
jgi:hypothetical protein